MRISLTLHLPRDEVTVPVTRHVCRNALRGLGVVDDVVSDIEIALTEACTNVVHHAGPGDEYEIGVDINPEACVIRVVDTGRGFDPTSPPSVAGQGDAGAERGRGIQLMQALVDRVHFVTKDENGTVVHLEKRLAFPPQAPLQRLADSGRRSTG